MNESTRRHSSRFVVAIAVATTLVGCAASDKAAPKSPAAAAESGAGSGYPQQPSPYSQPGTPTTSPQATGGIPGYPPPPPPAQPGQAADSPSRQASNDFDRAERELAVATSDCGNACRALGSMDRAAGNICKLTEDKPRCDDATTKVRGARSKVKNSCGDCKETSTNPADPVPSH